MATWTINGVSLESLGLSVASGSFRVQAVSSMQLLRDSDYDAAEVLSYGTAVTLALDGSPFFQGKVSSVPKYGDGDAEGQLIEISDAWEDLEATIYQESWNTGTDSVLQPRAVLGLGLVDAVWTNLTVAQQARAVVAYAIAQGVALQIGSIPTGERLLPTEVSNISCAEALKMALKYHPDWIPWIDHSTSPPTFNVTPIGSATASSFLINGSGTGRSFQVTAREDLLPASVRIVYESADQIDDEVYRKVYIDKYPVSGPDGGPRVLSASIPLEGMRMQIQKARIQTRTFPTSEATAKTWLKKKYPIIAGIDNDDFSVSTWSLELVQSDDAFPDPISPQAARLEVTDISELPRELVRGFVEDWMRKKVAPVRVYHAAEAAAGAPAGTAELLAKIPYATIVTGTDAVTKTYKSISSWSAAEAVPSGIAQAVYQALHAAMPHQGFVVVAAEELTGLPYHGRVVNLTGGPAGWETMAAPVHSVDWDVGSGTMTLGFGPSPHLAPADFLEMQRILRSRPITWWSFDERDSAQLGDTAGPSAQGDTVAPFEGPQSTPEQGGLAGQIFPFKIEVETVSEELRLYVGYGAATAMRWAEGHDTPETRERPLKWSSTAALRRDPFSSTTVGYAVLTAETEVGVWMIVSGAAATVTNAAGNAADADTIQQYHFDSANSRIEVTEDYITPDADYPWTTGEAAFFLGAVAVSAEGVATVKQYRRSDIVLGLSDMVRDINHP